MTTAVHDASLIAEAASGDVPAFAQLVDRYRAAVCSVALAIVRDGFVRHCRTVWRNDRRIGLAFVQ